MVKKMLSYRCYILPLVAGATYGLLSIPLVQEIITDWIPGYWYRILVTALIIVVVTFVVCRIIDNCCDKSHWREDDDWI